MNSCPSSKGIESYLPDTRIFWTVVSSSNSTKLFRSSIPSTCLSQKLQPKSTFVDKLSTKWNDKASRSFSSSTARVMFPATFTERFLPSKISTDSRNCCISGHCDCGSICLLMKLDPDTVSKTVMNRRRWRRVFTSLVWTIWFRVAKTNRDSCACRQVITCLLYTSPSPRDQRGSRMPSSA